MIIYTDRFPGGRRWDDDLEIVPHVDSHGLMIQIDEDRYNGAYSGFSYTAWLGVRPDDIDAGDPTCEKFWDTNRNKALFGGAETPQEAFRDLIRKLHSVNIYAFDEEDSFTPSAKIIIVFQGGQRGNKVMLRASDEFGAWFKRSDPHPNPGPYIIG